MKNASQIITYLQYKPQYHKLLEHKCINRIKSLFIPSIQNYIKYGYIKNQILFFALHTNLQKQDIDTNINAIKSALKSKMFLNSEQGFECQDVIIDDIKMYVDHKPTKKFVPFSTNAHKLRYKESAVGNFKVNILDTKLNQLVENIKELIKENHDS